jgi:3-oxoacyl-[acyl-carrier protein] reductase
MRGRTALVTGASRGIGRAVALELVSRGYKVAVNYNSSPDAAEAVLAEAKTRGEAMTVKADVSDPAQVKLMFEKVAETFGVVEVLVSNAGITRDTLLMRMSDEQWDDVIRTNLTSAYNCVKIALRSMMKARFGRILAVGSVSGLVGNAGQANYAAAKAGLCGLIKSAAREGASRGVTANVIAPGYVETDMTASLPEGVKRDILSKIPAGRYALPEDIAGAAAFLVSDEAGYINGQVLAVDGGMTM